MDDWARNQTGCDCSGTSYTGSKCDQDLGSNFNGANFIAYRLDPRQSLLSSPSVWFEFSFNHQALAPSKESAKESVKEPMAADRVSIMLLIVYEARYVLVAVDPQSNLVLSDVDEKGMGKSCVSLA